MIVTQHLPVDLLRSLQLIRQLDDESSICINQLDELALTVSTAEPEKYVQMARLLKISTQNRSIALTETCRLHKTVERHLDAIEQTLQSLQEALVENQQVKELEIINKEKLKTKKKHRNISKEPRYCFCNQISYGRMIACDNDKCKREWFHWDCVSITSVPKGKWTCSDECASSIGLKKKKKS
ncbi:hypothetical protein PNEG_01244 [Pneumocystis murina B123]|uniref:Zinc finger PHD-type domain-containing protein n=1 Tax=Pneumocystis murina (strain B123) TaxID=1069680 RepID=M7NTU6_PNEMU|nr:hypothetical protein PNEG_01244 [Pneumocystis murina B123]EMR10536.1 hypothetical protein PNEG_01244 [Pneumocystis murina B123]